MTSSKIEAHGREGHTWKVLTPYTKVIGQQQWLRVLHCDGCGAEKTDRVDITGAKIAGSDEWQ